MLVFAPDTPIRPVLPAHAPRRLPGLAAALLLAACLLTACELPGQSAPATVAVPTVELAPSDITTASAGPMALTLRANGNLNGAHETLLRAKVAGEVMSVKVREGDAVSAGQELARLDDLDYRARVDDSRANLSAGRAQAELALATQKRNEELLRKRFLSSQLYENARSAASVAEAQVQSLNAHVTLAEKALRDTSIRAPINGWIAARYIERGDKVSPDGPLFAIVDLRRLEIALQIPANEIARVAVGQTYSAAVEGYEGQRYQGKVARIGAQAAQGSRAVTVYVDIDNPDAALKAGLFAHGELILGEREATARVPLTALRSEAGVDFVYAIEHGKIRRREVRTGIRSEATGLVEISAGLAGDAQIVAVNLGPLPEGAQVTLTRRPAADDSHTR